MKSGINIYTISYPRIGDDKIILEQPQLTLMTHFGWGTIFQWTNVFWYHFNVSLLNWSDNNRGNALFDNKYSYDFHDTRLLFGRSPHTFISPESSYKFLRNSSFQTGISCHNCFCLIVFKMKTKIILFIMISMLIQKCELER